MKKKRMIAIFLAIVMVMMVPMSASAYNGSKAIEYADKHVFDYNTSEFQTGIGGDCTNFVSQCLDAGGLPQNSNWKYNGRSNSTASWYGADSLKNYLKYTYGAEQLVSKWTKSGYGSSYAYVNNSSNLDGDGDEVIFYDWTDDGKIDHAAFCVGTGFDSGAVIPTISFDYGDLINQHTTDRKRVLYHLDEHNAQRNTTAIYAFLI